MTHALDALDLALLEALQTHPRAGDLELSRVLTVARATVQSRLARLEQAGVVRGWSPEVSLEAAGFGVAAYVSLEIAQGALDSVREELLAIPAVVEAFVTTGTSDVLCRVVAASHAGLQDVLLDLNRSGSVVRSTSVMVLSTLIAPRTLPLLATTAAHRPPRAPAYRRGSERDGPLVDRGPARHRPPADVEASTPCPTSRPRPAPPWRARSTSRRRSPTPRRSSRPDRGR